MSTLYYNAAANSAWNNISNWWQDEAFSIPASAIPATGDTVYLEGYVGTGPTVAVTLAALFIAQINNESVLGSAGAGISTTGDLSVGKDSYGTGFIFTANLTIGGTAYFYGSSENGSTITVSQAIFNYSSVNQGSIQGDATFNDNAYNAGGTVTGNATFNGVANNSGTSTVDGNATFNDRSINYGLVSGNAAVYYPVARPLGGTVTGTITYFGYPEFYFNAAVDGTWNNSLNWWRDSSFSTPAGHIPTLNSFVYIEADLTTGPSTAITLSALSVAQINNGATFRSSGPGITITGNLTVGVKASLYGRIESAALYIVGTANFYGSNGGNSGTLSVLEANFYDDTSNYGIGQGASSNGVITGNSVFNNNSINYCTIETSATFNDNSYNASGATVDEYATFNDSSYNASGATAGYSTIFNDNSYNAGNTSTIIGEGATFNDNSYNASGGTVGGDATFNDNSYNASGGTIEGSATFNDSSYNASGSTVEFNAIFQNSSSNSGLVSGNASVYYPVFRPLGGTVTGTITYYNYPTVLPIFYFYGPGDGDWNNTSNWWQDNAFTVPANAIPMNGDSVYVESNVTIGPSTAVTLATLFVAQVNNGVILGNSGAGISTTRDLIVGSGVYLYGRIDNANLTIGGTAYFYGGNGGNSSTLTVGVANFYLASSNYGTGQGSATNGVITGNAFFYNNAKNYCSIGGTATFNDVSGNNSDGDITGSATFNDSSYNASGSTVGGNATFKNNSSNSGTVSGSASVYYPVIRPLGGTVTGTITYINYP